MGANMPSRRRLFSTRGPLARVIILTVTVILLAALTLRSDRVVVRSAILRNANSAIQHLKSSQQPLDGKSGENFNQIEGSDEMNKEPELGIHANFSHFMNCDYDMEHLVTLQKKYSLEDKFQYLKRYAKISREDIQRKSVTTLRQNFLPKNFSTITSSETYLNETCSEPLMVPVSKSPFPATANVSDFMFGVSTTYKRFSDPKTSPINEWSYWLTDSNGSSNGGKLLLMILGATEAELMDVYDKLTKIGIDVDVYHSDPAMEMAARYLTLVPTLYNHPERPNKKWLVMCDDDTFFPYPHALVERFAEYDADQPMYIGTLSEDVNSVDRHGSQAFGGAGVFLSVPMAKEAAGRYESCKSDEKIRESNSGWGPQGDILLRKCIYENTEVKLTFLRDLWQLDIYGDPSGFYESGIQPLSVHHYRGGWHTAYPFQYTKVAHLCGEDCTLQRFRTADNFVISTGFSVAQYPQGIDFDLGQFERTFVATPEDKGWNLDFTLGPQRQSLANTGRKWSWDLQESTMNEDGSIAQVYIRKHGDWRWKDAEGLAMGEMDGIVELVWIL